MTHKISKKWFKDEGVAPNYVYKNNQWEILDGVMNDRYSSGLMLTGLSEILSPTLRNKLHVIKISDASVAGLLLPFLLLSWLILSAFKRHCLTLKRFNLLYLNLRCCQLRKA